MFALFLFGTWALVVLIPVLEKRAKNDSGGVSIIPGFPIFPLLAWGLSAVLNWFRPRLGYYSIGGLHVILFIASIVYATKLLYRINRKS
jgi:hypothetical protein